MANTLDPNEKPMIHSPGYGSRLSDKTNAEITLGALTAEALRDIARNESVNLSWRKAAVKFLVTMNHNYQWHSELILIAAEIKEELKAEREVQAIVESAIEAPLDKVTESDNTI